MARVALALLVPLLLTVGGCQDCRVRPATRCPPLRAGLGGTVTLAGKPAPGALVSLRALEPGWALTAHTDEHGRFAFPELEPGSFQLLLTASRPGLGPLVRTVASDRACALVGELRLAPADVHVAGLARLFEIHGRVEGGAGRRVRVRLSNANAEPPSEILAGPGGSFGFTAPAGDYELFARTEAAPWRASHTATVTAGPQQTAAPTLQLGPAQQVSGRISDGLRPVAGASVALVPLESSTTPSRAISDRGGRFVLGPLPEGVYRMEAWAAGLLPIVGHVVRLPRAEPLEIRLEPGRSLRGTVVDANGVGVAGAVARAVLSGPARVFGARGDLGVVPGPVPPIPGQDDPLPPRGGRASASRMWTAITDAAGAFRLSGLPATRLTIVAQHPGFARGVAQVPPGGDRELRVALGPPRASRAAPLPSAERPDEGQPRRHRVIVLRDSVRLSGRVQDARTGAPVRRFALRLGDGQERPVHARTGTFAIEAAPGRHLLRVRARGFATRVIPVDVPDGAAFPPRLTVELAAAGIVHGAVLEADGRPMAGAIVRIAGVQAKSDRRGAFRLERVPEGTHDLAVIATDGRRLQTPGVSVRPGEQGGRLRLHFPPAE